MKEYRCTRNEPYTHDCLGKYDLTVRQGHYISAINEEAAWQQMAQRYPKETTVGFTVQEWERFDVKIVEVKRDENGNIIDGNPELD
ncbi:hypothetical protein FJR11_19355 [Anabaena sp. UHCC 0187]|uniref:hypothetical protein n=1 Tax=Anabaena sp. UHCC 0187 TaxID=2590018 RepID=UPI0014481A50|nr:hypothetical protein [Anabaena sp. UHCC 0187]MTJ14694.1 hypothetical protein [Anabaena sp. UHCC 0187]